MRHYVAAVVNVGVQEQRTTISAASGWNPLSGCSSVVPSRMRPGQNLLAVYLRVLVELGLSIAR